MSNKSFILTLALTSPLFASEFPSPLVEADWLAKNSCKPGIVVLDIRSEKIDGQGKSDYLQSHVPCAVHTDYIKAGWRVKKGEIPGMLPPTEKLESLIGGLGIDGDSQVVLVPRGHNASSMGSASLISTLKKLCCLSNLRILFAVRPEVRVHLQSLVPLKEISLIILVFHLGRDGLNFMNILAMNTNNVLNGSFDT